MWKIVTAPILYRRKKRRLEKLHELQADLFRNMRQARALVDDMSSLYPQLWDYDKRQRELERDIEMRKEWLKSGKGDYYDALIVAGYSMSNSARAAIKVVDSITNALDAQADVAKVLSGSRYSRPQQFKHLDERETIVAELECRKRQHDEVLRSIEQVKKQIDML